MLNADPVPLYFRLKEQIKSEIERGEYETDGPIPSENKLIEYFGVSRTTVRKAIDVLINEGILFSIQGRGTFVRSKFSQGLIKLTSCTEDIRDKGMNPSVQVVNNKVCLPNELTQDKLNLVNDENIFYLERIMYADKNPINKTKSHIPASLFKGIEQHDFSVESLYQVIEVNYGITIKYATRSIEATLCDKKTSRELDVEMNAPMLYFEGVVFAKINGLEVPIEYFESIYRSDKWKFNIEQVR